MRIHLITSIHSYQRLSLSTRSFGPFIDICSLWWDAVDIMWELIFFQQRKDLLILSYLATKQGRGLKMHQSFRITSTVFALFVLVQSFYHVTRTEHAEMKLLSVETFGSLCILLRSFHQSSSAFVWQTLKHSSTVKRQLGFKIVCLKFRLARSNLPKIGASNRVLQQTVKVFASWSYATKCCSIQTNSGASFIGSLWIPPP